MSDEIELAFQALEANGVPRERARSVANGIDVLVQRMQSEIDTDKVLITALVNELKSSAEARLGLEFIDRLREDLGRTAADVCDAERFRFLTADLSGDLRERRNALLERMATMSHSAASTDIDALIDEQEDPA